MDSWTVATGQGARWIALDLDLRAPRTWFGPSWALLAGVLSSGQVRLDAQSLLLVALAWLLAEPFMGSLAALSVRIAARRAALRISPAPVWHWSLPYMQPESPGRRALDALAAWAARLSRDRQSLEGAVERWLLLGLVTLLLAVMVSAEVALLTVAALAGLALLAAGRPLRANARKLLGAGHLFLSWLVGRGAFAAYDHRTLLVGLGYAVIWYAWTRRPPQAHLLVAAHVLLAGLFAALYAPISAVGILLLAVPLFVLWPESPSTERSYPKQTQVFLMASLLLAAWGLVK